VSHPREGWTPDGRRRTPPVTRRELLRGMGAGLGAAGLGALASACGNSAGASPTIKSVPLARKDNPVRWPIFKGNGPIASGLAPEQGATLKLYNWTAYINQTVLNNFAKKYNCKVEYTSFNTITDAISKIKSGEADYDVFVPTPDNLGQLIEAKLIQPLNHSYIPNIAQCWPDFEDPFYDLGWRYTVPYTVYTTGIAWRKDHVDGSPALWKNGYHFPWQAKYAGRVAILDDYRESISLGLIHNGIYDLNTTSASSLRLAKAALNDLDTLVGGVLIDNNDYTNVPSGQVWIHHAWSGDMAAAAGYMPKGVPVEVVGYWFPASGLGPVANDTMVILSTSKVPVLAHLFLNYLLDLPNVLENISFNGYIQPLTECTPQLLVKEKLLPPSLISTAVLPSYFRRGLFELELAPTVDVAWEQEWLEFSGGL